MHKLKILFFTIYQAYLILKLRKRMKGGLVVNNLEETSLKLACLSSPLLSNYRPVIGMGIFVKTHFSNAVHLLDWLSKTTTIIKKREYLDRDYMFPVTKTNVSSLDNYLVDYNYSGVDIVYFHKTLREVLNDLLTEITNVKDNELRNYYLRRLTLLTDDFVEIYEGLLLVTKTTT